MACAAYGGLGGTETGPAGNRRGSCRLVAGGNRRCGWAADAVISVGRRGGGRCGRDLRVGPHGLHLRRGDLAESGFVLRRIDEAGGLVDHFAGRGQNHIGWPSVHAVSPSRVRIVVHIHFHGYEIGLDRVRDVGTGKDFPSQCGMHGPQFLDQKWTKTNRLVWPAILRAISRFDCQRTADWAEDSDIAPRLNIATHSDKDPAFSHGYPSHVRKEKERNVAPSRPAAFPYRTASEKQTYVKLSGLDRICRFFRRKMERFYFFDLKSTIK